MERQNLLDRRYLINILHHNASDVTLLLFFTMVLLL